MNAPKKSTFYISLILASLGIILWIVGFIGLVPTLGFWLDVLGFLLLFIGWLLLTLACKIKGL